MKNPKVIAISITALFFMYLTFAVHWSFIAIAAFFSWMGWKDLMK
ncbi:MAG: hypothetical protein ABIG28_02335 [archaeon]